MDANGRKPWLAAALSLLLAGLGHLYAGKLRRSAWFYGGELVAMIVALFLLAFWSSAPWNVVVGAGLVLGWRIVAAVSASVSGEPACAGHSAWIRWPVYALVLVAGIFGPALALRATMFEAFRVPQASMAETIIPGDRILTTKWGIGSPDRGELVVFLAPAGVNFVKRVIGLPGDHVELRDGIAYVDGRRLDEPYARGKSDFGPVAVPEDSYFVLGDNRDRSKDSRAAEVGFVPADRLVARPRSIFFSEDPDTGEVRWDRVGLSLQ